MSKKLQRKKQKGFTLVELSIVLVIIGLIISSVLVGQDLVRSAELRAVVTEYEGFNAAVGTFRGRYNGLPGDIQGQTDYGWQGNGNEDGLLVATGAAAHGATENVFFWNHLGSTGAALISGSYAGVAITNTAAATTGGLPSTRVGGFWGVFTANGYNYYILGAAQPNAANNQTTAAILNALDARGIDEKIDDGRPGRGVVQARGANNTNADAAATTQAAAGGTTACTFGADVPSSQYNTQNENEVCTLRIRF